jgi:hypothetical protein
MRLEDLTGRQIIYLAGSLAGGAILAVGIAWMSVPSANSPANDPPASAGAISARTSASAADMQADPLLPAEFAVLQQRNVFGTSQDAHGPGASGGPEGTLVFRGAVSAGGVFTAFIEDLGAKNWIQATVGTALARGKIKSIDIDGIEYEAAGQSRRIEVGQDLNGQAAPVIATTQPAAPPEAAPDQAPPTPPPNGWPKRRGNPGNQAMMTSN